MEERKILVDKATETEGKAARVKEIATQEKAEAEVVLAAHLQ